MDLLQSKIMRVVGNPDHAKRHKPFSEPDLRRRGFQPPVRVTCGSRRLSREGAGRRRAPRSSTTARANEITLDENRADRYLRTPSCLQRIDDLQGSSQEARQLVRVDIF